MRNLLRANFSRLVKGKIFWLSLVVMAGFAGTVCYNRWSEMTTYDFIATVTDVMFNHLVVLGIAAAVFVSLFVGVEYSDGTIRNKLLVGRSRKDIFLSNFIACAVALTAVYALSVAVGFGLGKLLLEPSAVSAGRVWMTFGIGFFMVLAYAAVYNFIAMLLSNKTHTAIAAILLSFGLIVAAVYAQNCLSQPEYIQQLAPISAASDAEDAVMTEQVIDAHTGDTETTLTMNEDGVLSEMALETVPNPQYLAGAARERVQFILDVNPSGQAIQIAQMEFAHPVRIVLYDLGIVLIFCLGGVLLFRKKDIK